MFTQLVGGGGGGEGEEGAASCCQAREGVLVMQLMRVMRVMEEAQDGPDGVRRHVRIVILSQVTDSAYSHARFAAQMCGFPNGNG